jgi:hypothetical protein
MYNSYSYLVLLITSGHELDIEAQKGIKLGKQERLNV